MEHLTDTSTPTRPQPDIQPWSKRVMQFQPSSLRPREECERHYLDVHSAWAVRTFAAMDDLVSYHTNRVLRQWLRSEVVDPRVEIDAALSTVHDYFAQGSDTRAVVRQHNPPTSPDAPLLD